MSNSDSSPLLASTIPPLPDPAPDPSEIALLVADDDDYESSDDEGEGEDDEGEGEDDEGEFWTV